MEIPNLSQKELSTISEGQVGKIYFTNLCVKCEIE